MTFPGIPIVVLDSILRKDVRFLRASEILTTAFSAISGTPIRKGQGGVSSALAASVKKVLTSQLQVRGRPVSMTDVSWDLDVVEDPGGYTIMADGDWLKKVDSILGNSDCQRCGGLTVSGVPHEREDCDLVLVRDVIES